MTPWEGNEAWKARRQKTTALPVLAPASEALLLLDTRLNAQAGCILEWTLQLPPSVYDARRGFYIEYGPDQGVTLLVDSRGRVEICQTNAAGTSSQIELKVDREMDCASSARCRLMLQHSLAEFYLDDMLIECFSLPLSATGNIGLIRGGDPHAFSALEIWQ